MAKITKKAQKVFGTDLVATNNVSQLGSFKAGSVVYSTDPDTIQTLAAWGLGWGSAVVNNNAPTLQDMNGFCLVATRQLAYLVQAGVAEWDGTTTYYKGSIVQKLSGSDGTGILFAATADDVVGSLLTDVTKWECILPRGVTAATGPTPTIYYRDGAAVFDIAAGAGGNKTIALEALPNGAVVNVLVAGVAGNTVTWGVTQESGGSLTLNYGATYSNTMTSTKSLFTLIRVGTIVIINSLHGIA